LIIEEDEVILWEEELEWIKHDAKIMKLLESSKLKDLIKWIDSSWYPWRSLEWEMLKNEHFREFAYQLLEAIGHNST